jgi:hypothetical protein
MASSNSRTAAGDGASIDLATVRSPRREARFAADGGQSGGAPKPPRRCPAPADRADLNKKAKAR